MAQKRQRSADNTFGLLGAFSHKTFATLPPTMHVWHLKYGPGYTSLKGLTIFPPWWNYTCYFAMQCSSALQYRSTREGAKHLPHREPRSNYIGSPIYTVNLWSKVPCQNSIILFMHAQCNTDDINKNQYIIILCPLT